MSRLRRLLEEVHQRSLWQLLASYIVGAWLVLQIAETLASLIGLPLWFGAGVIALLAFGLVLVVTTGLVQVIAAYRSDPDRSYRGLRRLFSWKHALIAGLIAVALLVAGTGGYMGLRAMGIGPAGTLLAKGVLQERERIVLAEFENHTVDPFLGLAVTTAFFTDLSESRLLSVAEPSYVASVLRRMDRDPEATLDYGVAREVAIREGIGALIAGKISSAGGRYVLSVRLVSASTEEVLATGRETARDSTGIVSAIDRLSAGLRERIGESLRAIRRTPPLERVTTRSLEALRKYSLGVRAYGVAGDRDRARVFLEEATTLDPDFALAHRKYAVILSNMGHRGTEIEDAFTRAYELRDKLTDRERLLVSANYYQFVIQDRQQAAAAYKGLLEQYPDDATAMNNLAFVYGGLRQWEEAAQLYARQIQTDSSQSWIPYTNLSSQLVRLNDLAGAEAALRAAEKRFPGHPVIAIRSGQVAIARGDYEAARAHFLSLTESDTLDLRGGRDPHGWLAYVAATRGQLAEAEEHLGLALRASERQGDVNQILDRAISLALIDLWYRNQADRARERLETVLARYPIEEVPVPERHYLGLYSPGLVQFYALSGDTRLATQLLAEFEDASEPDELRRRPGYNHAKGIIALMERDVEGAIQELNLALAPPGDANYCDFCVAPLLGQAHEMARQPDTAIRYYELYLSVNGMVKIQWDAFWLPVVYERLGDLYEQRGDTAQAIHYYGKLIDLWEDADPELQPRVEAARRAIEALSTDR